jgi:hypothetical protein
MRCASQSKRPFPAGRAGRAFAEERRPVVPGDQYWAEPGSSSLKYAVEAHLLKPAADGVVVGAAHAPRGKPGPYLGVSLSVGRLKKMVAFAGTYDGACQKSRAPHVPKDLDSLSFQAASPDQDYPGFLKGGEPAELIDFSPAWGHRFALPTCEHELKAHIDGTVSGLPLSIETPLLEPDQGRSSLPWRAAVACDKRVLSVEEAAIQMKRLAGVAA